MSVPRDRDPGRDLSPQRHRVLLDERRRLLGAVVDVAVTVGFDEITVSGVCAAAGVSARRGFYRHFPDVRTAFVEACLEIDRQLRTAAATALATAIEEGPREQVEACVRAIVGFLVADPVRAEALLVHGYAGGAPIAQARDATMAGFVEHLRLLAAPLSAPGDGPDELVALMALGGAHEIVHRQVVAGTLDALPQRVPELVDLLVLPFTAHGASAGGGPVAESARCPS